MALEYIAAKCAACLGTGRLNGTPQDPFGGEDCDACYGSGRVAVALPRRRRFSPILAVAVAALVSLAAVAAAAIVRLLR